MKIHNGHRWFRDIKKKQKQKQKKTLSKKKFQ